jgi:hypothetical protein
MPYLIEHIDAIARQKQRDVLFVEFFPQAPGDDEDYFFSFLRYDPDEDNKRQALLNWLDEHNIGWFPCAPIADDCGFEQYRGQVYIDLPMDESDPTYCKLRDHLEQPDGSMRDEHIRFCVLRLEDALNNDQDDDPEFRD